MLERGEVADGGVRVRSGGVAAGGASRGTGRSGEEGESPTSALAAMLAWKDHISAKKGKMRVASNTIVIQVSLNLDVASLKICRLLEQ